MYALRLARALSADRVGTMPYLYPVPLFASHPIPSLSAGALSSPVKRSVCRASILPVLDQAPSLQPRSVETLRNLPLCLRSCCVCNMMQHAYLEKQTRRRSPLSPKSCNHIMHLSPFLHRIHTTFGFRSAEEEAKPQPSLRQVCVAEAPSHVWLAPWTTVPRR